MTIEIFSFFSGLGLLDLGLENAGMQIGFVNENNASFLRAYKYARRNSHIVPQYGYSDCSIEAFLDDAIWKNTFPDFDTREKNRIIGFAGGPPCPDFSVGGKNAGCKGKNGRLTETYIRLICKRKPDYFILENVKGLYRTKKHRTFYNRMKNKLYREGYSLFDSIENALEYGVPQYRDRLILIGFRRKKFGCRLNFSLGNHKSFSLDEIMKKNWPLQDPFEEKGTLSQPDNIIHELSINYWFKRNNVEDHPNGDDYFNTLSEEKYMKIPEGDTTGKSFKRLHRWRFSPTAAYGNNEVHLHPFHSRRISVAEAMAIQSLPESFEIEPDLSLSAKFKMVGNGVPYLLSLGIARDVIEWIEEKENRI